MQSALVPGVVLAVAAAVVLLRTLERRRAARLKISGGRKALALNLHRSRY
jgi:predicted Kef-type K+ transport protein